MQVIVIARGSQRRNSSSWRKLMLPVTAGAATGATLMYMADPERGRRRRAIARDRSLAAIRRSGRKANKLSRRTGAKIVGMATSAIHIPARLDQPVNDPMLTDRILSQVFRDREIPPGRVNINVEDGIAVIRGELDRPEQIRELQDAVKDVSGVREVASFLHLPEMTPLNKEPAQGAS